jgi:hypothetical protein
MRVNKLVLSIAAAFIAALVLASGIATAIARGSATGSTTSTAHSSTADPIAAARAATARYHSLSVAQGNGYAVLKDTAGIACIASPGVGAMGIHYVNGALVKSGQVDPLQPQALVYEPADNGQLQLVALEYVVFQQQWDATHHALPTLFGQQFMVTPAGNRFGLPAFYSLHAWIWKDNPTGMFSMWNPFVNCGADPMWTGSNPVAPTPAASADAPNPYVVGRLQPR